MSLDPRADQLLGLDGERIQAQRLAALERDTGPLQGPGGVVQATSTTAIVSNAVSPAVDWDLEVKLWVPNTPLPIIEFLAWADLTSNPGATARMFVGMPDSHGALAGLGISCVTWSAAQGSTGGKGTSPGRGLNGAYLTNAADNGYVGWIMLPLRRMVDPAQDLGKYQRVRIGFQGGGSTFGDRQLAARVT